MAVRKYRGGTPEVGPWTGLVPKASTQGAQGCVDWVRVSKPPTRLKIPGAADSVRDALAGKAFVIDNMTSVSVVGPVAGIERLVAGGCRSSSKSRRHEGEVALALRRSLLPAHSGATSRDFLIENRSWIPLARQSCA